MYKKIFYFIFFISLYRIDAYYFYKPLHDQILLFNEIPDKCECSLLVTGGYKKAQTYNINGHHVASPFAIWSNSENSLSMFEGYGPTSEETQLLNSLKSYDNGVRGHIILNGDYKIDAATTLMSQVRVGENMSVLFIIPWYHTSLKNITLIDLTENKNIQDLKVRTTITDNINELLKTYGNLEIHEWTHHGIGDIGCYIKWEYDFVQHKPLLKNVSLQLRCGVELPTGQHIDSNKILAHSFGNYRAVGLPFGGQLKLSLGDYCTCGIDAELTHIFNKTVNHRIKTAQNQTEFFLLQRSKAHFDFGMNQYVTLFGRLLYEPRGLQLTTAYEYFKHGDDQIGLHENAFNQAVANTAYYLQEKTAHHILVDFTCNVEKLFQKQWPVQPTVNIFIKVPFNGSNIHLTPLVGMGARVMF